jgi:predicted peptidase
MSQSKSHERQHRHTFETVLRLRYLLYLPQDYGRDPDEKWPLILFLHGMGERGDDLELVKIHGIPKMIAQGTDLPFLVVSPQCPDGTMWHDHHITLRALLGEMAADYAVDPDRLYLTGLSMGGFGTWSLAITNPELFAAIAPICGGGLPDWICGLKDVPVWAFHGAEDPIVPLEKGQRMVDALQACGGSVQFTVYPGVEHDSWTQTYANPQLYEWLLQHTRQKPIGASR